uniref:Uncharacterized protein n=1 Tax=Caulobacter sp. (strain K31) TaxID=366602 RepID=B0SXT1_CAUSK
MLALTLAIGVTGCDWAHDTEAPKRKVLTCELKDSPALVYILDTGERTATWANGPGAPKGRLSVNEFEYRLTFPGRNGVSSEVVINRYDGALVRKTPELATVKAGSAKPEIRWSCKAESKGPKF